MARESGLTPRELDEAWELVQAQLAHDATAGCVEIEEGARHYVMNQIYHSIRKIKQKRITRFTRPYKSGG